MSRRLANNHEINAALALLQPEEYTAARRYIAGLARAGLIRPDAEAHWLERISDWERFGREGRA